MTRAILRSALVARSRADARTIVRDGVDRPLGWAGRLAAPRLVDALIPHLVASAVPRIIDGVLPHLERRVVPELVEAAMPLLRARVIPAVIEDLAGSSLMQELVLEQSRGVVSHAADQLRDATAAADGRVEDAFRNVVHRVRGL